MNTNGKIANLTISTVAPDPTGSWNGEIVGVASVNFGQEVQPGSPRQSVEFTYAIMPVRLTGPGSSFAGPVSSRSPSPTR